MKKWQIVMSVVMALVAVLSLSVAVFAQGPQPPGGAPQGLGRGPMSRGMHANGAPGQILAPALRFGANGESLVDITAKVTALKIEDVVKELQVGKTFAEIAKANGKTAADLVNAFVTDRKAMLDKAVADGRITQDVADTMLATMKTNVEQHVNGTWQSPALRSGDFQPRGMGYCVTGQQPQFLGPGWIR
jgi:hypothetical protein